MMYCINVLTFSNVIYPYKMVISILHIWFSLALPPKNMADKECVCKENLKVDHTYVK